MQVGDTVVYIDDVGSGKVLEINGDQVLISIEGGFSAWVHRSQLMVKGSFDPGIISHPAPSGNPTGQAKAEPSKKKLGKLKQQKKTTFLEVDLHYEAITGRRDNQTPPFEKLQLQLDFAKKKLDYARQNGIPHVVFIHGNGVGRLKEELMEWLNSLTKVHYEDASYRDYGTGAIEVRVWR